MINFDQYKTDNSSLTHTQALQACAILAEPIFMPANVNAADRMNTRPILYADFLQIEGEQGWQRVPPFKSSQIHAGDLKGRPMFIQGKFTSGNFFGWYIDCNGVYRTVYQGATPSGADTNWSSNWDTDPIGDMKAIDLILTFPLITFEKMFLKSSDSYGSIINVCGCRATRFKHCEIQADNQGITLGGSFSTTIEHCSFGSNVPSWLWMDSAVWNRIKAGNGTAPDLAIKAAIDNRILNSWGLYVGGNAILTGNRIVWPGGIGLAINGNGCYAKGTYIERSFYGLVMGSFPFQDINTIASATLTTNKLVSGLPAANSVPLNQRAFVTDATVAFLPGTGTIVAGGGSNTAHVYSDGTNWRIGYIPIPWGTIGGEFDGLEMESCYRGVTLRNCNTELKHFNIIGHNALQYDGTDFSTGTGQVDYGILNYAMSKEYSDIICSVPDTARRSIASGGAAPLVINEEGTSRSRNQRISIEALSPTQKARFLAAIGG